MTAQHVFIVGESNAVRIALWTILSEAGCVPEMTCDRLDALKSLHTSPHRLVVVLDLDPAAGQRNSEGWGVFLRQVAAQAWLTSRHAYLALASTPDRVSPDITALLMRLQAPLLVKPFDVDTLLLLVADARERLYGDGLAQ